MSNLEEKKDAFEAYQKSNMTDRQLKVCADSVNDMIDTMIALGERGYLLSGYHQLSSSLQHMQYWRRLEAERRPISSLKEPSNG